MKLIYPIIISMLACTQVLPERRLLVEYVAMFPGLLCYYRELKVAVTESQLRLCMDESIEGQDIKDCCLPQEVVDLLLLPVDGIWNQDRREFEELKPDLLNEIEVCITYNAGEYCLHVNSAHVNTSLATGWLAKLQISGITDTTYVTVQNKYNCYGSFCLPQPIGVDEKNALLVDPNIVFRDTEEMISRINVYFYQEDASSLISHLKQLNEIKIRITDSNQHRPGLIYEDSQFTLATSDAGVSFNAPEGSSIAFEGSLAQLLELFYSPIPNLLFKPYTPEL